MRGANTERQSGNGRCRLASTISLKFSIGPPEALLSPRLPPRTSTNRLAIKTNYFNGTEEYYGEFTTNLNDYASNADESFFVSNHNWLSCCFYFQRMMGSTPDWIISFSFFSFPFLSIFMFSDYLRMMTMSRVY